MSGTTVGQHGRPTQRPRGRWQAFRARPVALAWVHVAVAALFTATSLLLMWRALAATGAAAQVTAGTWTALAVGVFALDLLLLGLVSYRWSYRVVLPLLLLLHASAAYFGFAYGVVVDPSMMRNVAVTDTREAGEYFTPSLFGALLLLGVLPAIAVWLVPVRRLPLLRALWLRVLFLLGATGLLALSLGLAFDGLGSLMRGHKHLRYLVAPGNVLVSALRVATEAPRGPRVRVQVSAYARQAPRPAGQRPQVLVLVVGETARAASWGLNGYARQTTPELARRPVVNFSDVTACGSSTEVSLPCMFSSQGRRDYDARAITGSESLLHLLARAGVQVRWRDNQTGCKGVCDGLPFESFRATTDPAWCGPNGCRDEILLDGLPAQLRALRTDAVIVLHQLGNHGPAYYRRYPAGTGRYQPDCRTPDLTRCTRQAVVNAYDNALLASDRMLGSAIDMLAATPQVDSALLYVSDHGESLGEKGLYLHGVPYAIAPDEQMKIPMVLWVSPGMQATRRMDMGCLRTRARKPADHDNLFHTVLGLMQVDVAPYRAAQDLLTPCMGGTAVAPAATAAPVPAAAPAAASGQRPAAVQATR